MEKKPFSSDNIALIPKDLRMTKRWIIAKQRSGYVTQKLINDTVENVYFILLKVIKDHQIKGTRVFERDYRRDNSQSALLMYAYLSPSVYLMLECDMLYNYKIEFGFDNCALEADTRSELKKINSSAIEKVFSEGFKSFYENVLNFQDQAYQYTI